MFSMVAVPAQCSNSMALMSNLDFWRMIFYTILWAFPHWTCQTCQTDSGSSRCEMLPIRHLTLLPMQIYHYFWGNHFWLENILKRFFTVSLMSIGSTTKYFPVVSSNSYSLCFFYHFFWMGPNSKSCDTLLFIWTFHQKNVHWFSFLTSKVNLNHIWQDSIVEERWTKEFTIILYSRNRLTSLFLYWSIPVKT